MAIKRVTYNTLSYLVAEIKDSNGDSKRYFHGDCWNRPLKPCNGRQYGRY